MNENFRNLENTSDVEEISQQDLGNIFQHELLREIFPDERILTNWIPYECLTSNIQFICNERCTIFGTNVKKIENADQSLLTFGHYCRLPSTLYYSIDVYGQNISVLPDHIIAHLKTLKLSSHNELTLALSYHDTVLNKYICDKITENFGFESSYEEKQYCTNGYIGNLCQDILRKQV